MNNEEPQHGRDEEQGFVFLGRYGEFDLWWGPEGAADYNLTLVARYGPHGDYMSGLTFGWCGDEGPLVEARKRAEARGLDVQREKYAGKMKQHPSGIWYGAGQEDQMTELFKD